MARSAILIQILLLLFFSADAQAERARQTRKQSDPLVRTLEAVYTKSMEVAGSGDLEAYLRFRTLASRDHAPRLTKELLPAFAQMLPPLSSLQFVRMDAAAGTARALYRWPREDMARYTIIVYRVEQNAWKIDSVVVKTDIVSHQPNTQLTDQLRGRASPAPRSN